MIKTKILQNKKKTTHIPTDNNINLGRHYYLQAADVDETLPNPFLSDSTGLNPEPTVAKARPPMRPPPPLSAQASPAHQQQQSNSMLISSGGGTQKSAFDDLNDSIFMAMGGGSGSPGKTVVVTQSNVITSSSSAMSQQLIYVMPGGGGANAVAMQNTPQIAQQIMYSSPARQQPNVAGP